MPMGMKIVALVPYRFDADHLDDLHRNLKGFADEVITVNDAAGDLMKDEGRFRTGMLELAKQAHADYVTFIDPDERVERSAAKKLRALVEQHAGENVLYQFRLREMYTPNKYRIDGVWGQKTKVMLFPLREENEYSKAVLHWPRHPINGGFKVLETGLNVYHLKHIRPELRRHRKELYLMLDPANQSNGAAGYKYLDDETGMELQKIPLGRGYAPKYRNYALADGFFDLNSFNSDRARPAPAREAPPAG